MIIGIGLLITGCASTGSNEADPWESWNRKVYSFNKSFDKAIAKPVTVGYKAVTPDVVESGVSNLFSNLGDIPNFLNNLFFYLCMGSLVYLGSVWSCDRFWRCGVTEVFGNFSRMNK